MGRKKTGKTPVFSYRIKPSIAEKLDAIYKQLGEDWTTVFEALLAKWEEINVIQKKVNVIQKSDEGENEMLNIFYKINPTLNYANKTQRAAVTRLYKKIGKEKALRTAEAAVATYGEKFAPVITNPLQLENKLSELISFYKKRETNTLIIS